MTDSVGVAGGRGGPTHQAPAEKQVPPCTRSPPKDSRGQGLVLEELSRKRQQGDTPNGKNHPC